MLDYWTVKHFKLLRNFFSFLYALVTFYDDSDELKIQPPVSTLINFSSPFSEPKTFHKQDLQFFSPFLASFRSFLLTYKDLDNDMEDNVSHVEGSTTVMSAGESETESENEQEQDIEIAETPYIHAQEDEFGAVSLDSFNFVSTLEHFLIVSTGW